jgi:hypothetical protein
MLHYIVKVALSAVLIVAIAEFAKRSSFWGALIAALPLTSLLAFVWLYLDTGDSRAVAALSTSIFWLVLPTLPLFLLLPFLLKSEVGFWPSLGISCVTTLILYLGLVEVLRRFKVLA